MTEKICNMITKVNKKITETMFVWIIYPLIIFMVVEVFARYFFKRPTFFAYDLTWMLYSAFSFLGGAYALISDSHVKADVFYNMMSKEKRAVTSIACYLVLFFPSIIGLTSSAWKMLYKAIIYNEKSVYTNWGPSVIPIKVVLFIAIILLSLQGCVEFYKSIQLLLQNKEGNK